MYLREAYLGMEKIGRLTSSELSRIVVHSTGVLGRFTSGLTGTEVALILMLLIKLDFVGCLLLIADRANGGGVFN